MSVRDEVYELVHALLLAALSADGATAGLVIPAEDTGPRPASSYIRVRIEALPELATLDTKREDTGANELTATGRQLHDARVSLQAFGETAVGWLESLRLRFGWLAVREVAEARSLGPVRNLNEFLDTRFEARAELEIGVYLEIVDDRGDTLVEAATVGLDALGETPTIPVE